MPYAPFDLTGKVALVTGGNRGIGLGFAEALTQAGASVAIWGSSEANNADAVKKLGGKTKAWTVNVADETQVAAAMVDVVKHFGRIDSVFANAGIGGGGKSFAEFPTDGERGRRGEQRCRRAARSAHWRSRTCRPPRWPPSTLHPRASSASPRWPPSKAPRATKPTPPPRALSSR